MKCPVCQHNTIHWWQRLSHLCGLPVRCAGCDARLISGSVLDQWPAVLKGPLKLFLKLNAMLGFVPMILLLAFLFAQAEWLVLGLILLLITLLRFHAPLVPDPADPVNRIIERVQQKKRTLKN